MDGSNALLIISPSLDSVLQDVGLDGTGSNGVDADTLLGVVDGSSLGQSHHGVLSCAILCGVNQSVESCDRCQIDNRATARLQHGADGILHAVINAQDVGVQLLLELVRLGVSQRCGTQRDARVVDNAVQLAELGHRLLDDLSHLLLVRHIQLEEGHIQPLVLGFLDECLTLLFTSTCNNHIPTVLCKLVSRSLTDTCCTTRNDNCSLHNRNFF